MGLIDVAGWLLLILGGPALVLWTSLVATWVLGLGLRFSSIVVMIAYFVYFPSLYVLLGVLKPSFMVSHLSIDANGIAFARSLGTPKFLTWKEIRLIRPATRREVFVQAWLRPWPNREPTKTMSACGHYRIEWFDGFVFFPPKDPALFETAVRKFGPGLLASGGHSSNPSE